MLWHTICSKCFWWTQRQWGKRVRLWVEQNYSLKVVFKLHLAEGNCRVWWYIIVGYQCGFVTIISPFWKVYKKSHDPLLIYIIPFVIAYSSFTVWFSSYFLRATNSYLQHLDHIVLHVACEEESNTSEKKTGREIYQVCTRAWFSFLTNSLSRTCSLFLLPVCQTTNAHE